MKLIFIRHFYFETVTGKIFCKKEKLYFDFADLEKAFDRVARDVARWALRKLSLKSGRLKL